MRIPAIVGVLALAACGGDSGGGGGPTEAQVKITSSGFQNNAISIPSGGRIHFFNNDSVNHQVTSSNCTELDTGVLTPGADSLRPVMTGPLNCTYNDVNNASFRGSVVVSAPGTGGGGSGY